MSTRRRTPFIIFSLVVLLAFALTGSAGAKELWVSSIPDGETGETIQISCKDSDKLDAYTIVLQWDPAVMNVTAVTNLQPIMGITHSTIPQSKEIIISGFSMGRESLSGDKVLFSITANAKVQDGHRTWVSLLANESLVIAEDGVEQKDQYILTNGTFTAADHVPPTITITSPDDKTTVSQTVDVAATITDAGGIVRGSIEVYVGGSKVEDPIITPNEDGRNTYTVTAQRKDVPVGKDVPVKVCATDLANYGNSTTHYVEVAEAGIKVKVADLVDNLYTNKTQPAISATFDEVKPATRSGCSSTVPMSLIDVTSTAKKKPARSRSTIPSTARLPTARTTSS
jgi:hypothetical protein